jgi:hypothetical protein
MTTVDYAVEEECSIPADEWTYPPTKRDVALHFGEWKGLKQIIPLLEEREPELRQLVPLYRTDL